MYMDTPPTFISLPQAGGHQLLKIRDTPVIKPTKQSEVEFYKDYLPMYPELQEFLPKFYGFGLTKDIKEIYTNDEYNLILEKGYTHYIELENLAMGRFIDIIDIKLGSIHLKSDARLEEVRDNVIRNRFSIIHAYKFRLDGAIINHTKYHKEECRNMNINQVEDIFKQINEKHLKTINTYINKLSAVLSSINLNIYGPSLLIIIDHELDDVIIKLIDFTVFEKCYKNHIIYDDLILSLKYVQNVLLFL